MNDTADTPGPPPVEDLAYADAVTELEAILEELEDDTIDVDRLATRVARAAELIRTCRSRITDTRVEVERIVAELDGPGSSPGR